MDITKINHNGGVQGMLANIYNVENQPRNANERWIWPNLWRDSTEPHTEGTGR